MRNVVFSILETPKWTTSWEGFFLMSSIGRFDVVRSLSTFDGVLATHNMISGRQELHRNQLVWSRISAATTHNCSRPYTRTHACWCWRIYIFWRTQCKSATDCCVAVRLSSVYFLAFVNLFFVASIRLLSSRKQRFILYVYESSAVEYNNEQKKTATMLNTVFVV